MKVAHVLRLLKEDGWYLVRIKGSHRQFKHPQKRGLVTVSGKPSDEVKKGTLSSVLRQAGLR
jgi:predicted RNA binding protein YcfA (HicA-like mRNA interferase family)